MGALKKMLIAEQMRINKEWNYNTQYEYAYWRNAIKEQEYSTQKNHIKKELKNNINKLN